MKSDERVRLLSLGKKPLKCDVKGLPSTTDPGFKLASTSPNNDLSSWMLFTRGGWKKIEGIIIKF